MPYYIWPNILDISFLVNLLAKFSSTPIQRHWNGINHILCYLRGTTYMSLFYFQEFTQCSPVKNICKCWISFISLQNPFANRVYIYLHLFICIKESLLKLFIRIYSTIVFDSRFPKDIIVQWHRPEIPKDKTISIVLIRRMQDTLFFLRTSKLFRIYCFTE